MHGDPIEAARLLAKVRGRLPSITQYRRHLRRSGSHTSVGSIENTVLPNTPPGEYVFTRGLTLGNGKIIVQNNR